MGSQIKYWAVLGIVLLLVIASAGRTFAQDENPPIEPPGVLGNGPSEPVVPAVSTPPTEPPDSPPVIEHPPETDPQSDVQPLVEQPEQIPSPEAPGDSTVSVSVPSEPQTQIDSQTNQTSKPTCQLTYSVSRMAIIR